MQLLSAVVVHQVQEIVRITKVLVVVVVVVLPRAGHQLLHPLPVQWAQVALVVAVLDLLVAFHFLALFTQEVVLVLHETVVAPLLLLY
jgi:hypothetical protein